MSFSLKRDLILSCIFVALCLLINDSEGRRKRHSRRNHIEEPEYPTHHNRHQSRNSDSIELPWEDSYEPIKFRARGRSMDEAAPAAADGEQPSVGAMAADMFANFAAKAWSKSKKLANSIMNSAALQKGLDYAKDTASSLSEKAMGAFTKYGGMALEKGQAVASDLASTAMEYGPTVLSNGATMAQSLAEKALATGYDIGSAALSKGGEIAGNLATKGVKMGMGLANSALKAMGSEEDKS